MKSKSRHSKLKFGLERVANAAQVLFKSVATPYSLGLLKTFETTGLKGLAQAKPPHPAEYVNPHRFSVDYLSYSFLRKLEVSADKVLLEQQAFEGFKAQERKNKLTNQTILNGFVQSNVEGILSDARRKIAQILGPFDAAEFACGFGWGPGSTASIKAADATLDVKIKESRMSVTPRAAKWLAAFIGSSQAWCRALDLTVDGPCTLLPGEFSMISCTKLTTTEKNVTSRRTIDPQPTGNLFLQKGPGAMIRRRMKKVGIDLNNQSTNQLLASVAHIYGFATVDLKDASNSLVYRLVELLLPCTWFDVLNHLRVPATDIGDTLGHKLEVFSLMGNGYTFELESLIFYALCWAIVRDEAGDLDTPIQVYGDDIIIAKEHFHRLREVFTLLGFSINDEKSFFEGQFYESCGRHYFGGVEVTPVFQKKSLVDRPSLIRCANRLVRWAYRMGLGGYLDIAAMDTYSYLAEEFVLMHDLAEVRRGSFFTARGKRREFRFSKAPTQPFTREGDVAMIDVDMQWSFSYPKLVTVEGLSYRPTSREGFGDALLVEILREKDQPGFYPDGSYILPKPYGLGAYREMMKVSNDPFVFMRYAGPPTLGQVNPRDVGHFTWTSGKVWVYPFLILGWE